MTLSVFCSMITTGRLFVERMSIYKIKMLVTSVKPGFPFRRDHFKLENNWWDKVKNIFQKVTIDLI